MYTKNNNAEYKKIDFSYLMLKFKYEMKYLEGYLSFTKDLVNDKGTRLSEEMYNDTKLAPENESLILDIFENEGKSLLCYYHHSAVVLIYSVLETVLSEICYEIFTNTSAKFSHDDLSSGSLIGKAKDYLVITSGLDFSLISGEWAEIGKYQNLRNIIVHQNSFFTKGRKGLKQKTSIKNNFPDIEISNLGDKFYIVKSSTLLKFIRTIEIFIYKILSYVEQVDFLTKYNDYPINLSNEDMPF
ncbi:hypothetical protein A4N84_13785 [Salmonella enterica subsp. enterica serovar Newport]|uniref:hypothetical protein n=1 Tax=Salmonella sp. SAL00670 TaxID=3159747 RepID=UPI0012762DE8|nr:hypothetical protein [Salmonella enterica]EAX9172656.1 hypothetical protein [Salmonella enterica]EDA3533283.1 hypothetical protein [Salmonella enterica subsp. enterica serovar Newport]